MASINCDKKYASKLLLFGEHIILKGAKALALPLPLFYGHWDYSSDFTKQQNLEQFASYLEQELVGDFDITFFNTELKKGLFFESNIPIGYGLGSSGALVAAIFDVFRKGEKFYSNMELRTYLGKMESFFHGSSSGIDPLICYLEETILLDNKCLIESVELPKFPDKKDWAFFILDTKSPRKTEFFVNLFLEKCKNPTYLDIIIQLITPLSNTAIDHFLKEQWATLFEVWHSISKLQQAYFLEMIPIAFQSIWKESLNNDLFKLKICGAGGGGFLLGMTTDFEATQKHMPDCTLKLLF